MLFFCTSRCLLPRAAQKNLTNDSSVVNPLVSMPSLSKNYQEIARMWLTASSNKMIQPQHVSPNSKKLVWWRCSHCEHLFTRRIDLHVKAGGKCPECNCTPSTEKSSSVVSLPTIVHRSRSTGSLASPEVLEVNRIHKSVADNDYLRRQEKRLLLPMLAKNYEKEKHKIDEKELIYVSPKLDGVRCVVSFNKKAKKLLFFSRAGTLFDCCDHFIERSLQPLFEKDPQLVLDGELYNDSQNKILLRKVGKQKNCKTSCAWLKQSPTVAFTKEDSEIIPFEKLMSAVRTTRAKRTPEIEALQKKLQYHIFDVLYASSVRCSEASYRERLTLLQKIFKNVISSKKGKNSQGCICLVPAVSCQLKDVDKYLSSSISAGYEGIMIRRVSPQFPISKASQGAGGYAYGQRSSLLLKYKTMQDDEFVIVDAVEGKGKWKGALGTFTCLAHDRKTRFSVSPAISEEKKKEIWKRNRAREFIGKFLTVQYQEISAEGVPRFPVGKVVRGSASKEDWV